MAENKRACATNGEKQGMTRDVVNWSVEKNQGQVLP